MFATRGAAVVLALGSLAACSAAPWGPGRVCVADSCVEAGDAAAASAAQDDDGGKDGSGAGGDGGGADANGAGKPDASGSDAGLPDGTVEAGDAEVDTRCAALLEGTYAVRDTAFSQGIVLGTPQVLTTIDYKRVVIEADGEGLQLTAELCLAQTLDASGSPSSVPAENLGYLSNEVTSPLAFDCDAMRWQTQPARLVGGFVPEVPEGCEGGASMATSWQGPCRCPTKGEEAELPLPNDADDCRVLDDDNDGDPGVTVRTTWMGIGGDMYVAFDREGHAEGEIDPDGYHVGGWADEGSENVTLGCDESVYFFDCPMPDIAPCNAEGVNEMIFVPIYPSLSCAAIRNDRTNLFEDFLAARRPETNQCFQSRPRIAH